MTLHFNQQTIQTDSHGYLKILQTGNQNWRKFLLNKKVFHLPKIIGKLFTLFVILSKYHTSPAIRMLVKALKEEYGAEKGNSLYLIKLFPQGAAKQATKIAGLPKPARCI